MSRPIISFYNMETEETIEREMNDTEFAAYEIELQLQTAMQAEAEAKAQAKAAAEGKLAVLGLTTDDLRALGL